MILNLLEEYSKIPSFLILNKIDKLRSKRALLELVKSLTCENIALEERKLKKKEAEQSKQLSEGGWPNFKSVFMVSSTNGDGVDKVVEFLESQAFSNPWEYRNNETSNQTPAQIIEQSVRARLLDYLPQEIPYLLKSQLEFFSDENNKVFASVIVLCPTKRHEMLVCGVGDGKLRQITDRVTSDLIQVFQMPVNLTISTVVISDKKDK